MINRTDLKAIALCVIYIAAIAGFMYLVATGNDLGAAAFVAVAAYASAVLMIIEYELRD